MRILLSTFLAGCCAGGLLADVRSPYGYDSHLIRPEEYPHLDRELALLGDAGTGWFRTGMRWDFIQKTPGKGDWDFSVYDDVIDKALAHGVSFLPIFHVHTAPRIQVEKPELWCDYVRRCVERYRGRVSHWEVWNEVNIWATAADNENKMSPETYAKLLRRTYQTVKDCDPNARVTSSGFAGIPYDYIERLYQLGAKDCFDVMNVHLYPGMRPEGAIDAKLEKLRALMAKYGDADKPVWLTETGLRADRREKLSVPGFAAAALKAADPARKAWRILLVEDEARRLSSATRLLRAELPDCTFDGCDFRSVERRLAEGAPDALFLPLNCTYPADAMDAVTNYVARGGTLVDMGGFSMYQPCHWKRTGRMKLTDGGGHADRRRLRFDVVSPYSDSRYPHQLKLRPFGSFEKIKVRGPLVNQRYFKPAGFKPGDVFEPLLVGTTSNGLEACSAAIIRYGSDMKGRLVLSGWSEPGVAPPTRDDQAVAVARNLSIAFAAGFEKVFWYSLCDCFGLVDPKDLASGERMPGHRTYKAFIQRRPAGSANLTRQWRNAVRTVYWPQWRRPDGSVAGAIWSVEPLEAHVRFVGNARFYNHFGECIPSPLGTSATGVMTLGPEPLFFEGAEVEVGDGVKFAPLTPSAEAAEVLRHRNKPKSKAFRDRFFPTYPSVCDVKKSTAREASPCLRGAVMYQLFTRMFTPEGTFKAAERKLPELKDLGVDIIYLTPHQLADDDPDPRYWSARQKACKHGNPKNPYRQKDFFTVDPEYGSAQDLKDFVAAAHRLGMKVMFDLVYFHCGPKAAFLGEHPDFIVRNADGTPRLGDWAFPEMDVSRRTVRDYLYANMEGFVRDYDVDGFRCDVADMLPVDFWEEGYLRCKALKSDLFMMCEGLKGDDQLLAFDLSYGFYTQWTMVEFLKGRQPASMLRAAWEAQRKDYPKNFHWMRCFENHDFANVVPGEKRKEELYGHDLNAAMIVTSFLLDGVPMLYNGQEIADAAPHSIFSNRDHGGWHIDWTKANEPHAVERRALVKRLTTLRHENPDLFDAPVTWLETGSPDRVYAFRRELADRPLTLAVNISQEAAVVRLGGADVTVPAQSFVIRR